MGREGGRQYIVEIATLWLITTVHIIFSKLLSLVLCITILTDVVSHITISQFYRIFSEAETYRIWKLVLFSCLSEK